MSRHRWAIAACIGLGAPVAAAAQDEPIQDNSFLLHEAYNQPAGVVQHVLTAEQHANGETLFVFGQEWPLAGVRHQVAFAVPFFCPCGEPGRDLGVGDLEVEYRYQAAGAEGGRIHIAPELALSLPTGDASLDRGVDALGVGVSIPLSITLTRTLVAHVNAGVSHLRRADWLLGASVVWLTRRRLNLLVEGVRDRETFTLSPGMRGAIDLGSVQIVPGVAMPVTFDEGESDAGWLLYLSVEHPYR